MANTPTDPHDPSRPGPKPRPPSITDSDWFASIPDLPASDPGKMPPMPTEADLDLDSIFAADPRPAARSEPPSKVAPASGWLTPGDRDTRVTPAAASDDDAEGSDIFSSGRRRARGGPNAFRLDDSADTDPVSSASGYSNIFDDEPAAHSGSLGQFFKGSGDSAAAPPDAGGTTSLDGLDGIDGVIGGGPGGSEDDLFLALDQPPSALFDGPDDSSNAVNDLMDELHLPFAPPKAQRPAPYGGGKGSPQGPATPGSGLDFNETANDASSSNLFNDLTEVDLQSLNSGVDLLNPDGVPSLPRRPRKPADGTDSGIFPKRGKSSSLINLDDFPLAGPGDDATEAMLLSDDAGVFDEAAASEIFKRSGPRPAAPDAGGDKSSVSFGSPSRHGRIVSLGAGQAGAASDDATGAIDWALPGELPAARRGKPVPPEDDGNADLSGRDDDGVEVTARMAPSSGIFDVDTSRETPLGSLSGFYPTGPKSGFATPASGVHRAGGQSPPPRSNARLNPARPESKLLLKAPAKPAAKSGLSWRGGAALGLAAGVLGGVAVTAVGLSLLGAPTPAGLPAPKAPVAARPASPDVALAQARNWLAAGEPELALPALEAAGDDAGPLDLASRGQARWLVRVRAAAKAGEAVRADDLAMRPALADLERTVASADRLQSPEEKRALVGAVLRLGLTKELSGDLSGATAYYVAAAAKYPDASRLFQAAATRARLMRGQGKLTLAPRDAAGLAEVALMAVLLVQGDAAADGTADEPGLLFWEAANRAAANDYANALHLIGEARAAHDARRLTLAGRGLNPLSDPVEQIFLKCCDELTSSWTLRRQLYSDPVAGPVFAKSGVAAGLKQLAAAGKPDPKVAQQLASAQADAKKAAAELAAATGEVAANVKAKDAALAEAVEAAKVAKAAKDKLAAAETDLVTATDAVAKVVSGLKAGKVVGPDDDAATVLKNLPEILKKVASAGDSADAKKAAEALAAARTELAAARAEATATTAKMDAAQADRAKALAEAVTSAKTQLDAQKSSYEAKMEAVTRDAKRQSDDARVQMASARAGVAVPLMTSELAAQSQAVGTYTRAVDFYFGNRPAEAEALLMKAVEQDAADARYWYFLGLSRLAQGKAGAPEAFQRGAEQEARSSPAVREINAALEKVQGDARRTLNGFRP